MTDFDWAGRRRIDSEAALLASALGAELTGADFERLDARPTVYGITDRPGARGLLPSVSAAGAPAHLARVADPKDPLGDTGAEAMGRRRLEHTAIVYARAAATLRGRRTTRSGPLAGRVTVLNFDDDDESDLT